jgi:hypothetical protein
MQQTCKDTLTCTQSTIFLDKTLNAILSLIEYDTAEMYVDHKNC